MSQSCRGQHGLGWGLLSQSRVMSSSATYWLCDLRQVTSPLCASMSSCINADGDIYPHLLLWDC